MKILTKLLAITIIVLAVSCAKHECVNTNPVFYKNEPESLVYKQELVNQLKKEGKFSFILTRYAEKGGVPLLYVDIHGSSLCAKAIITVTKPDNALYPIIRNKGIGYHGAELEDLTFSLESSKNEFIYEGLHSIID